MAFARSGDSPLISPDGGYLPHMVSYAQNFEDVMLRRALQDIKAGFYIDIGACDPIDLSVTLAFYEAGWSGVNIEPNPEFADSLSRARPRDVNLACAVAASDGTAEFHVVAGTGLSRLSDSEPEVVARNQARRHTITVTTRRLDRIWDEHAPQTGVDFLKIDAEGAEDAIIASTDFTIYRPRIIVIESTEAFSQRPAWSGFEPALLQADYLFAYFDGLNRYYVRKEDEFRLEAFALPPCLFDNYTPALVVALQKRIDELTIAHHHQQDLIDHQRLQLAQLSGVGDQDPVTLFEKTLVSATARLRAALETQETRKPAEISKADEGHGQ
jgi:FkbM family methyltransferase